MRSDPEAVASALRRAAKAFPDQRSGQIVVNALRAAGRTSDPFYVEDDALVAALNAYADLAWRK